MNSAPTGIELVGDRQVVITWEDGVVSTHGAEELRARCPCSVCTQEGSGGGGHAPIAVGQPLPLMPKKAQAGVSIKDLVPVGHYALRVVFSDGHDTGIYSFDYLRGLTKR